MNLVLDKPIVAIDFDGTITMESSMIWQHTRPNNDIFVENKVITSFIKNRRHLIYLVLWTCRTGEALERAVEYCRSLGIEFDAVNKNLPGVFKTSSKIYADVYLDDKGTCKIREVIQKCGI